MASTPRRCRCRSTMADGGIRNFAMIYAAASSERADVKVSSRTTEATAADKSKNAWPPEIWDACILAQRALLM
eukprot:10585553-Lingulodinium_polyedra.AAC.1